ncbi:MAG: hypothetical protein NTV00_04350 [Methylococcales bacterium]|nr:hypothetical protein [Methylococcales bacterium]
MPESSIRITINAALDWLQLRFQERSSWNGLTIIAISVMALVASPLIKYAAWIGLGYGAWLLWNKNQPS